MTFKITDGQLLTLSEISRSVNPHRSTARRTEGRGSGGSYLSAESLIRLGIIEKDPERGFGWFFISADGEALIRILGRAGKWIHTKAPVMANSRASRLGSLRGAK